MKTITPQVIRVRDFRSFNEEQVVSFAQQQGMLGLITGVNQAEPDLGANGTGKSTIWDALCWCLYGKTIRGLRGPSLMPWGVDVATPRVQFTFEVEGHRYTISRTANPNGVRLFREAQGPGADTTGIDGEEIDQPSIERMVGMDYDLFLSTVVRGQFADSFLELTPRKKMEFLSSALDLDSWAEAAASAADERKAVKATIRDAETRVSAANGTLSATSDAYSMTKKALEDAVAADESRRKSMSADKAEADRKHDLAANELGAVVDQLLDCRVRKEKAQAKLDSQSAALEDLLGDLGACQQSLAQATAKREIYESALSEAESLGSSCPTCHSDLSEESHRIAQNLAQKDLEEARALVDLTSKRCGQIEAEYEKSKKLQLAMKTAVWTLGDEIRKLELDQVSLRSQVEKFDLESESLEFEESADTKRLRGHYLQIEKKLSEAREAHTAALDDLEALQQTQKDLDFWVTGFQDIRLWLLRAALDELEALANSHTLALGLRGWRILFEVERETKSGTIAKGFRCFIQSPTNTEPVALESWSGGELQRLKLATQAAMCDLLRSRFGGSMALEVWDEPGQHLSARGCADMMAFFRERAATLGIEIWIVDHRSTASGDFDQQFVVTRTKAGTVVKRGLR